MRKIKNINIKEIKTTQDLLEAIKTYKAVKYAGIKIFFDTETTGLNIKYDKPFLLPWGFLDKDLNAYIYCVDAEKDEHLFQQTALAMINLAKTTALVGHNIKFDIHMLHNVNIPTKDVTLFEDTMILIRLAHDALTQENGGPPLALKEYAYKYIDHSAKDHEQEVKHERSEIAKQYNVDLKNKLYKIDKKWTMAYLDKYFKDVLNSADTLDKSIRSTYQEWHNALPKCVRDNMTLGRVETDNIPYTLVNRDKLIEYAMYDIVWTMETYIQCLPAIVARKNLKALDMEESIIPSLVRMEETGFYMNKEYIKQVTIDMAEYLKQQRKSLKDLIGTDISVGQHAVIKEILKTKYNLNVPGTGKDDLNRIYDELKIKTPNAEVVKFIGLIQELRTLEKWYSTYLLRFVREIELGRDRIYTQINQVGCVSGRVTSDFQQFPKYGINREDGTELFHPRRMILTSKGYRGIAYLDYSQVELRLQALYTILVGSPDLNLCRAYMPYECMHPTGYCGEWEEFDYKNPEHIKHAYDWDWYYKESSDVTGYTKKWVATDVHAATTHVAFPDIDTSTPEFKKLRGKVGKRVNFAKNYGAQFSRIKIMFPDYDDETIHRIDDAYYTAFPGVKKYHEYCYELAQAQPYAVNLFGVKYYGLSGHKLINCLVQGSGAYLLKGRIKEVDEFIQRNGLKSRMQMQIHDEVSYEIWPGEESYVKEFQNIMQKFDGTYVPIVADLEFTESTWADKVDCEEIQ